eukprot:258559-Pelagomonas_calceolata.AAC.1
MASSFVLDGLHSKACSRRGDVANAKEHDAEQSACTPQKQHWHHTYQREFEGCFHAVPLLARFMRARSRSLSPFSQVKGRIR